MKYYIQLGYKISIILIITEIKSLNLPYEQDF